MVSSRLQLFDSLGPLKIHLRLIRRTGGIALGLGLLFGVLASIHGCATFSGYLLASSAILWVTGLLDDLISLSVPSRLAPQLFAAVLLCLAGYRIPLLHSWAGVPVLILFALVSMNAFNFLDGSDGLACSVALVIAACFAGAFLLEPHSALSGIAIASSVAGACAAFLLFNLPPARIFLGDSGSTLLGFAFSLLSLEFVGGHSAKSHSFSVCLFPLFAAALPFLDFLFAVIRRWHRGRSILNGDRRHYYDLLLARGWTPRRVALSSAVITAGLCILGSAASQWKVNSAAEIFVVCLLLLGIPGVRLGIARAEGNVTPPAAPEEKLSRIAS